MSCALGKDLTAGAAVVGWWVFGEVLVPLDYVGVAMVGSALVLARIVTPPVTPRVRP